MLFISFCNHVLYAGKFVRRAFCWKICEKLIIEKQEKVLEISRLEITLFYCFKLFFEVKIYHKLKRGIYLIIRLETYSPTSKKRGSYSWGGNTIFRFFRYKYTLNLLFNSHIKY